MNHILLIGLGSALGGISRYMLNQGVHLILSRNFPYGTLSVNLLGCFVMGLLFVLTLEKFYNLAPLLKPFLLIGFLGGFTTFSSFSIETLNLFENNANFRALINIFVNTIGSLCLCWLGILLGKLIIK